MTEHEAYELLHPETTAKAIAKIEYYAGLQGRKAAIEAIKEACIVACNAIEELQEYKSIGSVEELREAKEIHQIAYHQDAYLQKDKEIFEKIENALGFRLYSWQKSYIYTGHFRRIGSTTAACLKRLLFDSVPIDYSERARNPKEDCERMQMYKIYNALQAAGITTNPILRSRKDKAAYMREKYIGEVSFANSIFEAEKIKPRRPF